MASAYHYRPDDSHRTRKNSPIVPILLFSGGLDSYIMWHLLGKPKCLYVKIGHRYEEKELCTIAKLQVKHPELDVVVADRLTLGDLELPNGIIPLRNLYFALIGSEYSDTIYYGALKGETSTDKSPRFIRKTNQLLQYLLQPSYWTKGRKVILVAPYRKYTKTRLVKAYLKRGFPQENLVNTISCYDETETHCGECMACFRRWVALHNNGIEEDYLKNPWEWEGAKIKWGSFTLRDALVAVPANIEAWRAFRR